ncbi:uncharacterized protein LOC119679859 [Teleopsis dalmanni]|uniref:uncharacterized protein LOC119673934 n=1 Tax=Teleopsis dalmanni TaxID=139649 RepID=UPI0018CE49CC|nr:uncharacterized protein LOC119673934 [Teleopsis dalmanni]XP_037948359.1 uncharacterized protein LOC119679859 [Teleopsis dalmanni]
MASLNVMCAICAEFYKSTDYVYSTTFCGHLFHQQCLLHWLTRAQNCPQCKRFCNRNRVHRVYLNFGERTAEDDALDEELSNSPIWLPLEPPTHNGPEKIPEGAIKAGKDQNGNDIYVARVYYAEDLLPANYIPNVGGAYTPYGCDAHFVRNDVEVLVECDCEWISAANGDVPPNAIITGYTSSGEHLYTGRAQYNNIMLPGKVHPSHKVLYMPYEGKEVNVKEYEVLTLIPKEKKNKTKE